MSLSQMVELRKELAAVTEELAETKKDYQCLASLLDGHDATECRMNLVRILKELDEVTKQRDEWESECQKNLRALDDAVSLALLLTKQRDGLVTAGENLMMATEKIGAPLSSAQNNLEMEGGEMTDKQINIAIAKTQGWKDVHFSSCWGDVVIGTLHNINGPDYAKTPNYAADLNAMHKAWQTLTQGQKLAYRGELAWIAARESINRQSCWMEDIAAEFGPEAFLRVVGKWTDEKGGDREQ